MLSSQARRFGEALIDRHAVTRQTMELAQKAASEANEPIDEALKRIAVISPKDYAAGYAAAVAVNYSLNRNWTFQARAGHGTTMVRYTVMAGVNFGSTLLIVLGLSHLGLYYLASKLISVAVNAGSNFLSARYWIFKD